jgi:hypothetical protein
MVYVCLAKEKEKEKVRRKRRGLRKMRRKG